MKIKSFIQYLKEGISPIVYHNTTTSNVVSILKYNRFQLSVDLGTDSDMLYNREDDRPYFLSTSRIKYGGYARSMNDSSLSCLVLDGTLLVQRFYGKPVDYWGSSYRNDSKSEYFLQNYENEDRLFSKNDYIDQATKYIKEIHVMLHNNYITMKYDYYSFEELSQSEQDKAILFTSYYQDILALCQVYNIPVYFYKDKKDFIIQNKSKAEPIKSNASKIILYYVELLTKDSRSSLSKEAEELVNKIKYYDKDELIQLKNHIHNNKRNEIELKKIGILTKEMNRHKLKGLVALIQFIKDKWK